MSVANTHFGANRIKEMLSDCHGVFFIGIGGINMSSLAHITKKRGYRVGGSDRTRTALTERLEAEGIEISYNHQKENIDGYDAVVYTVAISPENPEYAEAKRLGLPCISRADYLGYIMTGYRRRVGISGMHGKSTCTSMCAHTLITAKADPTVLSGAELSIMGGAYNVGSDDIFLFEACEYMDSFLDFYPTVAVILNIEMDHVDYFKSMEHIKNSFLRFASLTGDDGIAIYNADDENVLSALETYGGEGISFGIKNEKAYVRAVNIKSDRERYSFDVLENGRYICRIALSVTGYHNIYNALATYVSCTLLGLDPEEICKGLYGFGGAARRMELKGRLCGAPVYDDYGHHPTEVKTTLLGARGLAREDGRLICVFQSHTYSRTAALFDDFADALSVADVVIVADIYAARETDDLGVSAEKLAKAIGKKAIAAGNMAECARLLSEIIEESDAAVVMGAGDIYKVFPLLNFD